MFSWLRLDGSLSGLGAILLALWLLVGCGGSMNSGGSGGNPNPVPAPTPSSLDVVSYHYDNLRTGANTNETTLTPM
jgi:hypothetical protein